MLINYYPSYEHFPADISTSVLVHFHQLSALLTISVERQNILLFSYHHSSLFLIIFSTDEAMFPKALPINYWCKCILTLHWYTFVFLYILFCYFFYFRLMIFYILFVSLTINIYCNHYNFHYFWWLMLYFFYIFSNYYFIIKIVLLFI